MIPEIETERLMLRQATLSHLTDWAAHIFADPEVIRYLTRRDMTPYARAERVLNNYYRSWTCHQVGGWVITDKVEGQFIGSCEIEYGDETGEYELGYALSKMYWGQGIATEVARAVTRFGFESARLERIIAVVAPENTASRQVLNHLGFVYEKEVHCYGLDVMCYGIRRNQFQPDGSFYRVLAPKLA
jgi:RimJ/RimL family protein N-acetyltransferase